MLPKVLLDHGSRFSRGGTKVNDSFQVGLGQLGFAPRLTGITLFGNVEEMADAAMFSHGTNLCFHQILSTKTRNGLLLVGGTSRGDVTSSALLPLRPRPFNADAILNCLTSLSEDRAIFIMAMSTYIFQTARTLISRQSNNNRRLARAAEPIVDDATRRRRGDPTAGLLDIVQ